MDAILSLFREIRDAVGLHVPELAHVGMWNQNVAYAADDAPYGFPALLVEFGEIAWDSFLKHAGGLIARGEGTLFLHLLTEWHGDVDYELPLMLAGKIEMAIGAIESKSEYAIYNPVSTVISHDHGDLMETVDAYKVKFCRNFRIPPAGR